MTKNDLIKILSENEQDYISGEMLAQKLGISRTAVWKGINALKADGFNIEAIRNKGYRLGTENDVLSSEIISKNLTNPSSFRVQCSDVVDSTNLILKNRCDEQEGLVIVANSQEKGMGRIGRKFFSPENTGVYFSVLLKPTIRSDKTNFITAMAAVAVCRSVEKVFSVLPKIKWVNDIFLNGKKICGILTQGSFSLENNSAEYIILGVGINVYRPIEDFPDEILNVAGSILEKKNEGSLRNLLVAETLNEFWQLYQDPNFEEIAREYKQLSCVIGKDVDVISNGQSERATVLDIDENCRLVAKFDDGETRTIASGEVSVRV